MAGKLNIKTISDAAVKFQFTVKNDDWLNNVPAKKIPDSLSKEITLIKRKYPYKISEAAICETIIFPLLKSVWFDYQDDLTIWSHKMIRYNNTFVAIPDYLIGKQSDLGETIFGLPLLMAVIEAKKDNFEWGWGQCSSEMYIIQQNNKNPNLPVYGMVSNGDNWEFGILENNKLTVNPKGYTIDEIDQLYSVIHYIFKLCKQNALKIKNN